MENQRSIIWCFFRRTLKYSHPILFVFWFFWIRGWVIFELLRRALVSFEELMVLKTLVSRSPPSFFIASSNGRIKLFFDANCGPLRRPVSVCISDQTCPGCAVPFAFFCFDIFLYATFRRYNCVSSREEFASSARP